MATATLAPATQLEETTTPKQTLDQWESWVNGLTWAIVCIGISWRLGRFLAQFPVWGDEAHIAVNFLDRDFWGMTQKLDYGQVAPVLFLWLEWAMFHLCGPSELSLRFFPVMAGIAGLLLFWRFCRLTLPPLACSFAVAILAVSYFPVRHGAEIKPYSFDLFFTMALVLPAAHWASDPKRIGWLILLCLVTPVALAGSYPAVFVAGAVSLYLLPTVWRASLRRMPPPQDGRPRSALAWYVVFNLAMAATFLAHIALVGREQLDAQAGTVNVILQRYWQDWFPPANLFDVPAWLLLAHTGNMFAYPGGGPRFGSSATFLFCLVGLWVLWKQRRDLVTLCLVPFALSLAAAFLHRYPYGGSARLAQHLAPAICILMALGIVHLLSFVPRRTWQQKWIATILLALASFGIAGFVMDLYKPYKTLGDLHIRQLAQEMATQTRPDDMLVVYNPHDMARPNLVWYLRLLEVPIVWDGQADWPSIDADGRQLWGLHLRIKEGKKRPPDRMLAKSHARWSVLDHQEHVFEADSKDVPLQYCDVYRWVKQP